MVSADANVSMPPSFATIRNSSDSNDLGMNSPQGMPASSSNSVALSMNNSQGVPASFNPPVSFVSSIGHKNDISITLASAIAADSTLGGGIGASVVIMFAVLFVLLGLMAFVLLMQPDFSTSDEAQGRLMLSRQGSPQSVPKPV